MMRILNILAVISHLFITLVEGYQMSNVKYENRVTLEDLEPLTSIQLVPSSSTGRKCAIRCTSIPGVSGLFYNRHDGRCLCSTTLHRPKDTLLSSEGFRYYIKDECKIDGYYQLLNGFCVKHYETDLPYGQAQNYCENEGGRLVRLDTKSKVFNLQLYLKLVTTKENPVYYIDGTLKNGEFVFSDNTVIPDSVLDWYPYEPTYLPGDDCLCMFTDHYLHGDTTCSGYVYGYNFGFVCERVM